MKLIEFVKTAKIQVVTYKVRGYLDPLQKYIQHLCVETRLLGKTVWTRTVFKEEIPSGNYMSYLCTGMTTWKSARPDLVTIWQKEINKRKNKS